MSEIQRQTKILWVILGLLLLINIATIVYSLVTDKEIYPLAGPQGVEGLKGDKGDKGDPGRTPVRGVDYFDGRDGSQGPPGPQGPTGPQGVEGPEGIQGSEGEPGPVGEQGPQGEQGAPGEPGQNGREVEFRHNDEQDRTEWRYVGDDNWQVLYEDCEITDTCV